MAARDSGGGGGYDRTVRTAGRQRMGRARHRLLLLCSILTFFGVPIALFFTWSYLTASLAKSPGWIWYVALLVFAIWSVLLNYLYRLLQHENQRLDALEDRELQLQLYADRDLQSRSQGREIRISPKQEAEDFDKMMVRLDSTSQGGVAHRTAQGTGGAEDSSEGLQVAVSHVGILANLINLLIQRNGQLRKSTPKSLPSQVLESSSSDQELSRSPKDDPPSDRP